jgi:hypothetical protein
MSALLIEAGKLQASDKVLGPRPDLDTDPTIRVALTGERAALLLPRGGYKLSAAQALERRTTSRARTTCMQVGGRTPAVSSQKHCCDQEKSRARADMRMTV